MTERRRAALLRVVLEVADVSAVVAVSAAEIDRDGAGPSQLRALGGALESVAVADSVNLVDWFELKNVKVGRDRGVPRLRVRRPQGLRHAGACEGDHRVGPAIASTSTERPLRGLRRPQVVAAKPTVWDTISGSPARRARGGTEGLVRQDARSRAAQMAIRWFRASMNSIERSRYPR